MKIKNILALVLILKSTVVSSAEKTPYELKDIGIHEQLGQSVDLNLELKNEAGETVKLSHFFHPKKPVVLLMAYYGCPNLCSMFLNAAIDTFKKSKWTPGAEYEVVTVSFDPREDSTLAKNKKATHIEALAKAGAEKGWHFLVNDKILKADEGGNVKALADSVGFKFQYEKKSNEFAHAASMIFLTPSGRVSRYLYGIEFPEKDFKLALQEAAGNRIGTIVDRFMLFCYKYDPVSKRYSLYAMNLMRGAAAITIIFLGLWIASNRRRGKINKQQLNSGSVSSRAERRL